MSSEQKNDIRFRNSRDLAGFDILDDGVFTHGIIETNGGLVQLLQVSERLSKHDLKSNALCKNQNLRTRVVDTGVP
jgi:hypothetical protein